MSNIPRPRPEEVDHLLRNAQLRDELEPFLDESIYCVNESELPTPVENEFLASMLAWERAPVLPISKWFEPELVLAHPNSLSDDELHDALWDAVQKLYDKRIVLDFTDHLSDRQLYRLIYCDILPSPEKKIDAVANYLHWDCSGSHDDPDVWLRYYASEDERLDWYESTQDSLPPAEPPPFPRELPRQPL
jgi:hypothetical protein